MIIFRCNHCKREFDITGRPNLGLMGKPEDNSANKATAKNLSAEKKQELQSRLAAYANLQEALGKQPQEYCFSCRDKIKKLEQEAVDKTRKAFLLD